MIASVLSARLSSRQAVPFVFKSLAVISLITLIKHPAASSGVLTALLQSAGFQPAFAPRGGELNPQRFNV
jgi:hypothetical protein